MKRLYILYVMLFMHLLRIEASFYEAFNRKNLKTGIVSLLSASTTFASIHALNNINPPFCLESFKTAFSLDTVWRDNTYFWQTIAASGVVGLLIGSHKSLYSALFRSSSTNLRDIETSSNNTSEFLTKLYNTTYHSLDSSEECTKPDQIPTLCKKAIKACFENPILSENFDNIIIEDYEGKK